MIQIINLTPHDIHVGTKVFLASGVVARCSEYPTILPKWEELLGVPIAKMSYGAVEGLPDQQLDVYYIVSSLVRTALPKRQDLLSPGGLIRDDQGRPCGSTYLIKNK